MDISSIETVIGLGVAAAATLGLAVLAFTAGLKMWKRLRGAS